MTAILNLKSNIFVLFSKFILLIATKRGSDIGRGKEHLVRKYDIKWASSWEMAAVLNVKNCIFAPLKQIDKPQNGMKVFFILSGVFLQF